MQQMMLGNRIIKVGMFHLLTGRRREASEDMCHRYGSSAWLSTPSATSSSWPVILSLNLYSLAKDNKKCVFIFN